MGIETKELESIIIKKQTMLGSLNEKEAISKKTVNNRFNRDNLLSKGYTEEQIEQLILKGKERISERYDNIKTRIRKEIIKLEKEIGEANN